MIKLVVLRKLSEEHKERIEQLKKIFGVKTAAKAVKRFLEEGKL